jgi:hypothetical protein
MVKNSIYFAFLIFIVGCNPFVFKKKEHCESIKNYMRMDVEIINRILKMGDTLLVKANYYNFSDSIIEFTLSSSALLSNPDVMESTICLMILFI